MLKSNVKMHNPQKIFNVFNGPLHSIGSCGHIYESYIFLDKADNWNSFVMNFSMLNYTRKLKYNELDAWW